MSRVLEMLRSRRLPRAAVLALISAGVAGCSGDTSRFNDNPFASLTHPEATASIPQAQTAQAPQPSVAGSGKTMVSNGTGSVVRKSGSSGNWSWDGGTAITVAPGESVDTIAKRYGVPASALMQANNIAAPATLHPGQHLVIPHQAPTRLATAAAPRPATPTPAVPATTAAANQNVHVVAAINEIAKANNIQPTATLSVGDRLIIPAAQAPAAKIAAAATPAPQKAIVASAASKETEPVPSASVVAPADALDKEAAKLADANSVVPKFRWPANGRVIAGYGPTTNGQQNDGINIALPENTPVKAAEDGVVAYAGNELKGYGNLVLVRHPNGYVTAYAHAKELLVKRGDQVKRGQMIARSGQTGNVNTPQLHFEIRKGSSPLDPTRFLNGA